MSDSALTPARPVTILVTVAGPRRRGAGPLFTSLELCGRPMMPKTPMTTCLRGVLLTAALLCAAGLADARGADEVTEAEAGDVFRESFLHGLTVQRRARKLESILLGYPPNRWTDDAIWTLAELNLEEGFLEQSARLHEILLRTKGKLCLEPFTRRTWVYHHSRLRFTIWLLERTGHRYWKGRRPLAAIPYNPLPMSANAQLGYIYERLQRTGEALVRYRAALGLCPRGTLLEAIYRGRVQRLEEELKRREASRVHPRPAGKVTGGAEQGRIERAAADSPEGRDRTRRDQNRKDEERQKEQEKEGWQKVRADEQG